MKKEILNFDGIEFILNYADETFQGKLEKGNCQGIISVTYLPKKLETEMQSLNIFHENSIAIIAAIQNVLEKNKDFYSQFDYELDFYHTIWHGFRDDFGNPYTGSIIKEIKIDLRN